MIGYQTGSGPYEYSAHDHGDGGVGARYDQGHGNGLDKDALGSDAYHGAHARSSASSGVLNDALHIAPGQSTATATTTTTITTLADLKDPIQVHLLTETALSDSKDYAILTQEEVDKLKKQCHFWTQRVDVTRSNLAIQSKYRDAAVSMAKLHAAGKSEEDLRDDQAAREAERERRILDDKCHDLARELLELEKQLLAPQRRLLQHTAGILQLTHKVSKRKAQQASGQVHNGGMPSSPESLYTLSHSRDSVALPMDDNFFDGPGLFRMDSVESRPPPPPPPLQKSAIGIPLRSPSRDKATQVLRTEIDSVRQENTNLNSIITQTEKKLTALTLALRETIIRFNPDANGDYLEPPRPSSSSDSTKLGDMLRSQVDYLESGLVAVQAEQESFVGNSTGAGTSNGVREVGGDDEIESILVGLWDKIQAGFAETKQRNEERRRHRVERGFEDDNEPEDDVFDVSEAYSLAAFSRRVEWLYQQTSTLKDQKSVLKRQIKQQRELNNKTDAEKDEEIERRREELDQTRLLLDRAEKDAMDAQTMLSDTLQDLEETRAAAGQAGAAEGELQARSARIEALEKEVRARTTRIESLEAEEQARSTRIESLEEEVRARSARIESLEGEVQARDDMIESLGGEVRARGARIASLEAESQAGSAQMKAWEEKVAHLESKREDSGPKAQELSSRLDEATRERQRAEDTARSLQQEMEYSKADLTHKDRELAQREEEIEQLSMTIAELKTEVTIARAELDGAYGSRAERAADVAALKNNAEVVKLMNHVERLKRELAGTVADLEAITKETIGAERERMDLEQKLDEAVLDKAALEADVRRAREQVAKLQEELDNERFRTPAAQGGPGRLGAGASMLSEQFRVTMREERKKFQEDIREERAKIRRLEEELNRLKRSQAPKPR